MCRYDVGDDESQDSAEAAVAAAQVAAKVPKKGFPRGSSGGEDHATAALAAAAKAAVLRASAYEVEVATLQAETAGLRRAYAALEADALARAEEQEAVKHRQRRDP